MDNPVGDFKVWFRSLPLFTRTFISGSFIIACLLSLKLMSIYTFIFDLHSTIFRLNVLNNATVDLETVYLLHVLGRFFFQLDVQRLFCLFCIVSSRDRHI
jgi:hypothetical protein